MLFEIVTIKEVKLSIWKICREKREAQKLSRDELATPAQPIAQYHPEY